MSLTKKSEVTGVISTLERRNNSRNGNPSWRITLDGGAVLDTATDVSVSYGSTTPSLGMCRFGSTSTLMDELLMRYRR